MKRREFLTLCSILGISPLMANNSKELMPALFISHGSPINIIRDNAYTKSLRNIATTFKKPKAIVVISAHWYEDKTYISSLDKQKTIYDFYNFPDRLYKIKYEPAGSKKISLFTKELLGTSAKLEKRGLDHGAWSVLYHMYPKQDIPTFQISINKNLEYEDYFKIGNLLYELRKHDILVIGSGGAVHNLRALKYPPYDKQIDSWAYNFDKYIKDSFDTKNFRNLMDAKFHDDFQISHPFDDHYIPLLYTAGMVDKDDKIEHFFEGMERGNLSMRCIKVG